jgi:hypothetical protein
MSMVNSHYYDGDVNNNTQEDGKWTNKPLDTSRAKMVVKRAERARCCTTGVNTINVVAIPWELGAMRGNRFNEEHRQFECTYVLYSNAALGNPLSGMEIIVISFLTVTKAIINLRVPVFQVLESVALQII